MKTSDLIEQRAAIVARMSAAHEADDNGAFEAAETELRALDARLERQRKIDAADRAELGTPINGDHKLTSEIRSKFHIGRAIAGAAGLSVDWGFEREMQAELAKRAGRAAEGVFIPTECFETRALTTTTGAELVPTEHRPDQYINALVASAKVRTLGATVLSGLTGNLSIPRETDSPAIGWVAENTALTADDADFDSITLSPKHAGALSEWSRNMLLQASPDVEALLRRMLARNLALAIDKAAINGSGVGAEPRGILNFAGIGNVAVGINGGPLTGDLARDLIAAVDILDAPTNSRAFLSTPAVKAAATKLKDGQGNYMGLPTVFAGERAEFSNSVPSGLTKGTGTGLSAVLYGDWSELLIGIWSEIDILVNPFESIAYSKGNVSIRAMATVDTALRHVASFAAIKDAK
ncbi:MAG: major capsid protein [Sphingobium sp. 66-54]|nr:MAG: major capsid protein [Sphingobium sp. 66-54]